MQRRHEVFAGTLAILALIVGCSSIAQPTEPDDTQMASSAEVAQTSAPASFQAVPVTPKDEPGFIKVSQDLRLALGSLRNAPAQQSIDMLRKLRGNLFVPGHEKQLAAYVLARLVNSQSKTPEAQQEAINLYLEAAGNKSLSTPARMHAAEIALNANDEKKIQEALSPLLKKAEALARAEKDRAKSKDKSPPLQRDPQLPEALYRLGESYYRAKETGSAINVFERVRELYRDTDYGVASAYYLGTISLETDGDWTTALKEYRQYLKESPGGKFSVKAANMMLQAANPAATGHDTTGGADAVSTPAQPGGVIPGGSGSPSLPATPYSGQPIVLTPNDRSLIALAYYKHGSYQSALDQWNTAGVKHIYRAVCLQKTKHPQEAAATLLQSVEADPGNPLITEVASALCVPRSTKDAQALWQEILKRNPEKIDVALWNVAKRAGVPDGAPYYAKLIAARPTSEFAPESAWWLVWHEAKQAYQQPGTPAGKAHFAKALAQCDKALKSYSQTHIGPKFAFWKGKLLEAVGQKAQATDAYQYAAVTYAGNYYAYRSGQRFLFLRTQPAPGQPVETAPDKRPMPDRRWSMIIGRKYPEGNWSWPGPPALFQWGSLSHMMGETAATLLWLGEYEDCFDNSTGKISQEVKAWIYLQQGLIMKANANAGWKLEGLPQATARWQFAFPLLYGNIVEREAKKRGLDPFLVHGLIRQESRYDAKAVSRSNAMGLMQLLPGTAFGVAKHNGIPFKEARDAFNPDTNIQLGCAYLAYVLKRHENNPMLAVASYNGGPNAVAKWMKQHQVSGATDLDVYVENIPYDETRDYVRKVFSHYWNYEHLYLVAKK